MDAPAWLWIVCTVLAAAAQTLRNVMQRNLIERVGTVGATHVRFLFGLPFGLALLATIWLASGQSLPVLSPGFGRWVLTGGVLQMLGTGLMLAAMRERSFVIATAYVKTEPVLVALFGLTFLGELLSPGTAVAIVLATAGVLMMSQPSRSAAAATASTATNATASTATNATASTATNVDARFAWQPMVLGVGAGAMFAISAVGYRGAVLALGDAPFYLRASTALACALTIQTLLLTDFLLARNRHVLIEIFRAWQPSVMAGFMGALASQFWLLAFTLHAAAPVRTLGLIEILFAQALSRRLFAQSTRPREAVGIGLVVIGVVLLLNV